MILSDSSKIMLCEGSKTSPYLRLTLNLKHIIYLKYTYSYKMKYENRIKLSNEASYESL